MNRGSSSLTARVARSTAIVAGLGAGIAAVITGLLADRLLRAREDQMLLDAARTLVFELAETDGSKVQAKAKLVDERLENAHAGLRFAILENDELIGSAGGIEPLEGPGCATSSTSGREMRRCGVVVGRRLVIAGASLEPFSFVRVPFVVAALLAVLSVALVAALVSGLVARWAVRPLTRLRDAVALVSAEHPAKAKLGTAEGVREVDELRRTLADLLDRLDIALSYARRFAAHAAHEMRTPLAMLRGELELLAEHPPQPNELRRELLRVQHSLSAMSSLVERLLVLAKPSDRLAGEAEAVALADIVGDAHEALDETQQSRVTVHADDEGLVRGDASLLRALVENALDNALKFSRNAPVDVVVIRENGGIVLRVIDGGPGIPSEARERVFEAFYRDPVARASTNGHGVGLALVAHVAAAHGGDVRFEDVANGASLRVQLPAWAETS